MSQIHPVQVLLDEHRTIEAVLDRFEDMLMALDRGPFPKNWLARALRFFHRFVEGAHHAKEEERFFPALQQAGLMEEIAHLPVGVAWLEDAERNLSAAAGGDRQAIENLRLNGHNYARFLREHIAREDDVLRRAVSQPATAIELVRLQEQVRPEGSQPEEDAYEQYLALADDLIAAPAA